MDKRVLILLLAIIIVISFALGLQYFTGSKCVPPEISFQQKTYYVGDVVIFASPSLEDYPITWNFGDSTTTQEGDTIQHVYDKPGKYKIAAIRDEKNKDEDFIEILAMPVVASVNFQKVKPSVSKSQNVIYENKSVTFKDNTGGITQWKWKIKETGETGDNQFFRTSFNKSGNYSISLTITGEGLNGDTTFSIRVLKLPDLPPKPKPDIKPKPDVKPKPDIKPKPDKPKPIINDPWIGRMRDPEFKDKFKEVGNLLGDDGSEGDKASDEWANIISKEMLDYNATEVLITFENGKKPFPYKMEMFKNKLQNGEWLITDVQPPMRDDNKLVTKLSVKIKVIKE